MKTGVELIAEERWEQIYKHGYDLNHDDNHGVELELHAAILILEHTDARVFDQGEPIEDEWGLLKRTKGDIIHRLKVAGALIAAKIDVLLNENMP